jgi:MraZ protein
MFFGEYQHTIDTKGRLAIPSRFRGRLERGAVLVKGIEDCLYVYPLEAWEEIAHKLDAANLTPEQRRRAERRFFGMATDCELDAQGRIVIAPGFRKHASLRGETIIIGANHRFEIWNSERWNAYQEELAGEDLSGIDLPF